MEKVYRFISKNKEMTQEAGRYISEYLSRGDVILLQGDLGAGKTTFVSGVAQGFEIDEAVLSPTFNIMKCYFKGKKPLYHIDAYRLEGQNIEIGLDEFIEGDGVCFIEWPQYIAPLIPEERLEIEIHNLGGDTREFTLKGNNEHFREVIERMEERFK